MLKNRLQGNEAEGAKEMSELCPSDDDMYGADSEDYQDVVSEDEDDASFFNLAKLNGRFVGKE